jgi:lysylphosphatidylglycerol synthetase-like protein (DUF2156 family)
MANMDVTDRNQLDRSTLASNEGLRRGSEKGSAIYSVIALIVGICLGIVALSTIENWTQWLVLGAIVITMVGFMIALSPNRRGSEQH